MKSTGSISAIEKPVILLNAKPTCNLLEYQTLYGDSMLANFHPGDIVSLKPVNNLDVILWGEPYFIVGSKNVDNFRIVRNLHPYTDTTKIILKASNPDYGDVVIDKKDILSLHSIIGTVRKEQL